MRKYFKTILVLQSLSAILTTSGANAFRQDQHNGERAKAGTEQQLNRVRRVMLPLLQATDHRIAIDDIRLTIVDEAKINAASGGSGQFYVTTGLLRQATDEQLRGVLAHEIAHEDLGHPTKAQVLGAGIGLGAALLEKVFPGSGAIAPIAGTVVTGHYSRPMELAAVTCLLFL